MLSAHSSRSSPRTMLGVSRRARSSHWESWAGRKKARTTSRAVRGRATARGCFLSLLMSGPLQRDLHSGPHALLAGEAEDPAVDGGDLLAQSQAQPGAALGPGPGLVHHTKGLGDPVQL